MPTDAVSVSIAIITIARLRNHSATEKGNVDHTSFKTFFTFKALKIDIE